MLEYVLLMIGQCLVISARAESVATLDERSQSWLFLKILLTKSCDWAYEKEWRICKERKKPDPVTGLYFCPFGDLLNLREILIGFRCSNKADIKSRLDKLVAGYSPKPEIFFTRRSLSTFEIERVPL